MINSVQKNNVTYLKKANSEIVNNSAVLQNDNDFLINIEANSIYKIEIYMSVLSIVDAGFKCDWSISGGVSQLTARHCLGVSNSNDTDNMNARMRSSVHNLATSISYGTESSTSATNKETFLVTTLGAAAGTLQLRWSQTTATVSDTSLTSSSFCIITKLI